MRKFIYSAAAIALAFFAASCQPEGLEPTAANGTVTYTVEVPGAVATKSAVPADGVNNVNELVYEVYRILNETEVAGEKVFTLADDALYRGTAAVSAGKATFKVSYVNNQNHLVLFWAHQEGNGLYNVSDLRNVTVNQAVAGNTHATAAFTGTDVLRNGVSEQLNNFGSVKLTRPVAQLNIATSMESLNLYNGRKVEVTASSVTVSGLYASFDVATQQVSGADAAVNYTTASSADLGNLMNDTYKVVSMNYVGFIPAEGALVNVDYTLTTSEGTITNEVSSVPVKRNVRTHLVGNLISNDSDYDVELDPEWDDDIYDEGTHGEINGQAFVKVNTNEELAIALADVDVDIIILTQDIDLVDIMTRSASADPRLTIPNGKTLTIDLNGKTLGAVSNQSGSNYDMIDVRGNLTIKNGNVVYEHKGANMGWSSSTCLFNITAGGVLNLENLTAQNLGGSDMAFVAHLNNWGEATLNVNNSTLESTYIAVRAFNSGYDMNNITITNSTLKGKYCFWVHNYTLAGDNVGTDETLNLDILNGTNVFEATGKAPILYGFNNPIYYDANGYLYVADGVFQDADGVYYVSNAAGLAYMNTIFAKRTAGQKVVLNLASDIDFTGYTWTPVDSHVDFGFQIAEINGNGHTISNLTINGQAMFTRFAGTGNVVVKDITFDNANVNSNGNINTAVIVGHTYQNVFFDNVDVKNSTIIGGYKVAPLIGTVYNEAPSAITATIKGCDVVNTIVKATSYDFCTTGMVAFVYAGDNDQVAFENSTVSNVKLYAPNVYTAHAAIYTTGSETLFNEAEGVTVTNVTFENI